MPQPTGRRRRDSPHRLVAGGARPPGQREAGLHLFWAQSPPKAFESSSRPRCRDLDRPAAGGHPSGRPLAGHAHPPVGPRRGGVLTPMPSGRRAGSLARAVGARIGMASGTLAQRTRTGPTGICPAEPTPARPGSASVTWAHRWEPIKAHACSSRWETIRACLEMDSAVQAPAANLRRCRNPGLSRSAPGARVALRLTPRPAAGGRRSAQSPLPEEKQK
jgi:hypothetical protein